MKFNIDDRIITIDNSKIRKGVITSNYSVSLGIVIVAFDDGEVAKIPVDNVALEPKAEIIENEPKVSEESKNDVLEKSEITLTPKTFGEIASKITAEHNRGETVERFSRDCLLVAKLHIALFGSVQ